MAYGQAAQNGLEATIAGGRSGSAGANPLPIALYDLQ